jgi:hypothetical protein
MIIFTAQLALAKRFLRTIFLRRSTSIDLKRQIQMYCLEAAIDAYAKNYRRCRASVSIYLTNFNHGLTTEG